MPTTTFDQLQKLGWVLTANGFEHLVELERRKQKPSPPPDKKQVEICTKWIETHARPRKSVNKKSFSYRLKHRVEEHAKTYISNGAFITAALALGYSNFEHDRPNATFRMGLVHRREKNGQETPIPYDEWPDRYKH
jgi:hypothetical protein